MLHQKEYIHLIKKMIAIRQDTRRCDGYDSDVTVSLTDVDSEIIPNDQLFSTLLEGLKEERINMGEGRSFENIIRDFEQTDEGILIRGSRTDRLKAFLLQLRGRDSRTGGAVRTVENTLIAEPIRSFDWRLLRITIVEYTHMKAEYQDISNERWVTIVRDESCERLGMGSRKRNEVMPGKLWAIFSSLAGTSGILNYQDPVIGQNSGQRRTNKKLLKSKLQALFKVPKTNDPFTNLGRSQYKAKFSIIFEPACERHSSLSTTASRATESTHDEIMDGYEEMLQGGVEES